MENIIEKLQKEAGLTQEQAVKSLSVIKDFMDKEDLHIDWEKFFKGKYTDFKDSLSSFFHKVSDKAADLGDKVSDTVNDLTDQAKEKIENISKKEEK